jgi:hypothetical protein
MSEEQPISLSPEPLHINPQLIAVDLDGVLVTGKTYAEIDGATRLLQELKQRKLQIVLMSQSPKDRKKDLFKQFPRWKKLISATLWRENLNTLNPAQQLWMDHMEQQYPQTFNLIQETFLQWKYPPLWAIGVIIDDASGYLTNELTQLGNFGFLAIDPQDGLTEDSINWVDKILAKVDQWQASIK